MRKSVRGPATAGLVSVFTFGFLAAIRGDAAELITTIAPTQSGFISGGGYGAIDLPNGILMPLTDPAYGTELWFVDGTPGGTRLVRDFRPGPEGSMTGGVSPYARVGQVGVFVANDGIHGHELWRSDGTEAGTYMLADIGPGPQPFNEYGNLSGTVHDDVLYFRANDTINGNELWRTDGTREGTYLVSDIEPGYAGSYPGILDTDSDVVFFNRPNDSLWVTDGTSAGTRRVSSATASWNNIVTIGDVIFYAGREPLHGTELWRVDVDGNNAQMVANLNTRDEGGNDASSDPQYLFVRGNSVIFVARTPTATYVSGRNDDCKLFRADVSGGSITELVNFEGRCGIENIINLPGGALFSHTASDGNGGDVPELWLTDGTAAGTQRLDLDGLYYSTSSTTTSGHFKAAYGENGEAYFFGRLPSANRAETKPDKIWRTDGTRAGTRIFADLTTTSTDLEIVWMNGRLYFDAGAWDTHPLGNELWTTDGTPGGTFLVRDIAPNVPSAISAQITNLRVVNGRLSFFATRTGTQVVPYSSDGTESGTVMLGRPDSDFHQPGDANVAFAAQLGTRAVFAADSGKNTQDRELYVTDGTPAGTSILRDIMAGYSASPDNFLKLGNQMLFVAEALYIGRELWSTDGTSAGTIRLADIVEGRNDGNVTMGGPSSILAGVAYFRAGNAELWRTDGTAAGTFKVPGDVGERVTILGGNGSRLLYTAFKQGAPNLWSWDGSAAQGIPAANSLRISSDPGVTFNGRVCFRALEADPQYLDVWCANGTAGDLVRATNLATLGQSAGDLQTLGDKLLVNARGFGAATGLYATTGTVAGMQRISSERMGSASARTFGNSQLVFLGEGGDLWLTDGTSAGTHRLLEGISVPGTVPGAFGVLGNYVVFVVNDATRGAVLWRTDGTSAGTRYLADLDPGTSAVNAQSNAFFTLGDRLLYSGFVAGAGTRMWSFNATDPNASDDAAAATGGAPVVVNVAENDADFDGSINAATVTIVTQPAHGTATVNAATGAISYTATITYSGTDTLTYRISDDQGRQSNVATITFQVTAGAAPPPPPPPPPPPSRGGGGGGGGALGLELCGLLAFAAWAGRRRRHPDIG